MTAEHELLDIPDLGWTGDFGERIDDWIIGLWFILGMFMWVMQ